MDYRVVMKCKDRLTGNRIESGTILEYCDYLCERGRNWISGYVDGVKIEVPERFVISVDEFNKGKDITIDFDNIQTRKYIWHPDRRIFTVEDTQDYNSSKIIKAYTIIDDWCDNEDGTYDISFDGIESYRITADSVEFMLGG